MLRFLATIERVFFHTNVLLVTRKNPLGLGGTVQTKDELNRAISAGGWGPARSVRLSGRRVRGMDLEC